MRADHKYSTGASLVELLVAVAILSGGMVGTIIAMAQIMKMHITTLQRSEALALTSGLLEQFKLAVCLAQPSAFQNTAGEWENVISDTNGTNDSLLPASQAEWNTRNPSLPSFQYPGPAPNMFMVTTDFATGTVAPLILGTAPGAGWKINVGSSVVTYVFDYQVDDRIPSGGEGALDTVGGAAISKVVVLRVRWPIETLQYSYTEKLFIGSQSCGPSS